MLLGGEKAFTFDQVYDSGAPQELVYSETVRPLLDSFFQGFNVTVFAYGQTGSGKTHTMGTNDGKVAGLECINPNAGIIPRIVAETFERIERERAEASASAHCVKVSFLEIHNDDIHDLLDTTPKTCTLREDNTGAVLVSGLEEFDVKSSRELLECLGRGSSNRATAATCMNSVSSRSHAVFTITMEKTCSAPPSDANVSAGTGADGAGDGVGSLQGSSVIARLHLVDLAGSERAKRTKAEGQRLKEGININKGLLALGNVISALTGEAGAGGHVPYRDSKLTRMLQDSLGGNSRTLMIACVSPADSNFEETLNTLKYANRAKNIKNKAIVNVSNSNAEIAALRAQILSLQSQLAGGGGGSGGGASAGEEGMVIMDSERVKALEVEIRRLKNQVYQINLEATRKAKKVLALEIKNDKLRLLLQQNGISDECDACINESRHSLEGAEAGEEGGLVLDGGESVVIDASEEAAGSAGHVMMQHTMQQAALSDQLHTIEESLGLKEKLLQQLQEGEERMHNLKMADEAELEQMRAQVLSLQAEKEELLKVANSKAKVSALEEQLSAMKRRVLETERALRLKHDSDRRINELRNDIDSMKSGKIALLRKIKADADQFRAWRVEQQQEVTHLKRQNKMAQYEMHKMQTQLDKQQSVLKRKMEEANAANMRLKSLLQKKECSKPTLHARPAVSSVTADSKGGTDDSSGAQPGLDGWLTSELRYCVEVRRVRNLLTEQMAQRANLGQEIHLVKEQLSAARAQEAQEHAAPASGLKAKLAALQNQWKARQGLLTGSELSAQLSQRLKTLEDNVATCSGAIGQLQRELLEVEGNNDRERNVAINCPHVRTIQDAKRAVRFLFSTLVKSEVRASDSVIDQSEVEARAEALAAEVSRLTSDLASVESKYKTEMIKQEQAAEEKRLHLLSALTSSAVDDVHEETRDHTDLGAVKEESGLEGIASQAAADSGGLTAGKGATVVSSRNQALLARLQLQQQEIDRLAEVAAERNALMSLQQEQAQMLEAKAKEVEELRRLSGGKAKAPPRKKKVEVISSESEIEEEEEEEEIESASDDEWVPTAPKNRGGGGRVGGGRRGRASSDSASALAEEAEDEGGQEDKAAKSKSIKSKKAPAAEPNAEDQEWHDAEEMIPSLPDLHAMKVAALKDLCQRHNLKKGGKKDELVQRLYEKSTKAGLVGTSATMSVDQQGQSVEYKVKLGVAGAVMMSARSSLSDGDVDGEMTVADGNCRQLMSTDDSDQVKPVLAKDMAVAPAALEDDLTVENLEENNWKDGARFSEELDTFDESSPGETSEPSHTAAPLTARENDFAAAIEKMQSYIDLTARKSKKQAAATDDAATSAVAGETSAGVHGMLNRLDSLKAQVGNRPKPADAAPASAPGAISDEAVEAAPRQAKTAASQGDSVENGSSGSAGHLKLAISAAADAKGAISELAAKTAVTGAIGTLSWRVKHDKDGDAKSCAPSASKPGAKTAAGKPPPLLLSGHASSSVTERGAGAGTAEKRKGLAPITSASVNSRLTQPLKSLTGKIEKKPTLQAVIGAKPKEGDETGYEKRKKELLGDSVASAGCNPPGVSGTSSTAKHATSFAKTPAPTAKIPFGNSSNVNKAGKPTPRP